MTGKELEYLYDNIRVELSEIDFIIAEEVWQIYVSGDGEALKDYLNKTHFWGSLHLLQNPPWKLICKRLPGKRKRLKFISRTKNYLIFIIMVLKPGWKFASDFGETEKIYGMGDLEIDIYLDRLKGKGLINL